MSTSETFVSFIDQLAQPRTNTRCVAHLGPTNSGKTHSALDLLARAGAGVYAAPLRMLAQEGAEKLARLTHTPVGLITGEERINERAPIIACTTELAPASGHLLVLDEVHWAADPQRGHAWTRLLLGADYNELHLLGAIDVLPLLRNIFTSGLEIIHYERKCPLSYVKATTLRRLEPGSVVIGFSRKVVLSIACDLERLRPGKVAVLYGAMPPAARRAQIRRFLSGEAEVCVATDVLGHGVNLPCHTIAFAETTKFDGVSRRPLRAWELAQIAGRAGRYGHAEEGFVCVLRGLKWAYPDSSLVRRALIPRVEIEGGLYGHRRIKAARLRPTLAELGTEDPRELAAALHNWQKKAGEAADCHPWPCLEDINPLLEKLILFKTTGALDKLSLADAWTLTTSPLDLSSDRAILSLIASALTNPLRVDELSKQMQLQLEQVERATLSWAETIAQEARALRWFSYHWPDYGITPASAAELELRASTRVSSLIAGELKEGRYGHCASCGKRCAPWFDQCEDCHYRDSSFW